MRRFSCQTRQGKSFINKAEQGLGQQFNNVAVLCWRTNIEELLKKFSCAVTEQWDTALGGWSQTHSVTSDCVLVSSPPTARPTGAGAAGSSISHTHTHSDWGTVKCVMVRQEFKFNMKSCSWPYWFISACKENNVLKLFSKIKPLPSLKWLQNKTNF